MSQNENARTITATSGYQEDSESTQTAPEDEPDSQAVVLYRPRTTNTVNDESVSDVMPPRACPRGTVPIRPTASSQYVGLSTANYFRHITTTTTTTTTQTLKATSAASCQAATPSRQQQQNHISGSSGQPQIAVRSSDATPIQAINSPSHRRRIDHRGPEETPQTLSAKGLASQPHYHTTSEPTAARVEDHEHTVVDLMDYGLRHDLMDDKLFKVLYDRATKELVRPEYIVRFNILMEQFCDAHPSLYRDREFSEDESILARRPSRTAPTPTNQAQRQPSQQPQQPGQVVASRPVQDIQRQGPRSQQVPPSPSSRRPESILNNEGRREGANQNHGDQPQIHKRTSDQLDSISPEHVISMKRTRTEHRNRSNNSHR
ncbi:MAG: hypothetical protein J3Q66DRAFT_407788 [Benniella sp.]|nr:MAG: hypothetical protein J3Q66DRAFT_407788 [Benniella sp.]